MEKKKIGSVLTKIANVLTIIICVFVLIIAVIALTSSINGYNNVFGSTVLAVKTNSMNGEKEDSFEKGDLIVAKLLNEDEQKELKVGDVITFWTLIDGKRDLNTHRITEIDEGPSIGYITKGDANTGIDTLRVPAYEVVGKYQYKIENMGNGLLFLQSKTGFLCFVVIPSALALAYCVFLFISNLKGYKKEKDVENKEKMKQELLNEINNSKDEEKTGKSDTDTNAKQG